MLTFLKLENFRCFSNHEVVFSPLCLLVGQNNAGKSTIIDALRLNLGDQSLPYVKLFGGTPVAGCPETGEGIYSIPPWLSL